MKAVYAWIINKGTQSVYGPEDLTIYARIHALPDDVLNAEPTIKLVKHNDDQSETILIPRYKQFTDSVIGMAHHNIQFQDIAGNHTIAVSLLAPRDWHYDLSSTTPIFSTHILTDKKQDRYVIAIPVTSLTDVVHQLETQKIQIEHIYDY